MSTRFTRYWDRITGELSDVMLSIREPKPPTPEEIFMEQNPAFGPLTPPPTYDVVELTELLKTKIMRVTFRTAEGDVRTMDCTTNPAIVPPAKPKTVTEVTKPSDSNLFKVYSTDRKGWRSFRMERVIHIQPLSGL